MKAIYSLHVYGQFSCRIPSVNGKRFLKSAMGGHHHNEATRKFYDALSELRTTNRDITDIDGYLSIDQPKSKFGKDRLDDAKQLMKALEKAFPRITEWEEVDFMTVATAN